MCSLMEAYQTFSEEPPRVEEKRKKKRRAPLPPPEPLIVDPDRPIQPLPPAERLTGTPATNTTSTSFSEMLNAAQSADFFPHPSSDVSENVYNLSPDWTTVFNDDTAPEWIRERMPPKQAEQPLVPSPWIDGAPTLWQAISPDYRGQPGLQTASKNADSRLDALQRRLDTMFDKMDAMDRVRAESVHLEIILFVLGGLFLILLIDLLVKQGTQASLFYASAGVPTSGLMGYS